MKDNSGDERIIKSTPGTQIMNDRKGWRVRPTNQKLVLARDALPASVTFVQSIIKSTPGTQIMNDRKGWRVRPTNQKLVLARDALPASVTFVQSGHQAHKSR